MLEQILLITIKIKLKRKIRRIKRIMHSVCNPSDILESSLSMHDKYRYAKIRKSYAELLEKYDNLLKNLNYRDFELKRDLEMAKSIDKETTIVLARALNLCESMTCTLST